MILGHRTLLERVNELFPVTLPHKIGASSCDVRIGTEVISENEVKYGIGDRTEDYPWLIDPGEFLLASMLEWTVVPRDLSCMFLLKSTPARQGYGHAFSGWIDPGWNGILTMEIKNYNRETPLPIWPGMPIGQLIYMQTIHSGQYKGRYQHSSGVEGALAEVEYDAGG